MKKKIELVPELATSPLLQHELIDERRIPYIIYDVIWSI